ncbi:MAG: metallophosphoesterase [Caldilineaceae bacterium]|nr:metallophosphoesterase [Caldilineaceae bacterium]
MLTRRRFLHLIGSAALAGAAGLGYGGLVERAWVDIEQITARLPGMAESLSGFRIAQLSDIHLSRFTTVDQLMAAVTRVNELQPDIVVLTGDYVGHESRFSVGLIEPLRILDAPAYAVYGNHDLWTDRDAVGAALAETPVTLLVNQSREAAPGLIIAGLDDAWSGHPRPHLALAGTPSYNTNLLLCHEPDYFDTIRREKLPVALQLSGHSHGGQVRLPSNRPDGSGLATRAPLLPHMATRYPIGHYRVGSYQLYTNRGLGVWPLPFRLNCRPEITLLTLRPA